MSVSRRMTEMIEELRAKTALAKRLLAKAEDPMTRAQLKAYAEECEAALARIDDETSTWAPPAAGENARR